MVASNALVQDPSFPASRKCSFVQKLFQVVADGRESACAVGLALMSTKDIKEKNKGDAVESYHYLGDGLWNNLTV